MSDGVPDRIERERLEREFLAEAEDRLDAFGDRLRRLEEAGSETDRAALAQAMFREVHSLKALAGSLGAGLLGDLAHDAEELLDGLRRGTIAPGAEILGLLHEALDGLVLLARRLPAGEAGPDPEIDRLRRRLREAGRGADAAAATAPGPAAPGGEEAAASIALDPLVRAALTVQEEARLAACLRAGRGIVELRLALPARTVDADLPRLLDDLRGAGEVLSVLPSLAPAEGDRIGFTLILATEAPEEELRGRLPIHAPGIRRLREPAASSAPDPAGPTPPQPGPGPDDLQGVSSSIRVPAWRLDDLLAQVGDLSIAAAALLRQVRTAREARPSDRALVAIEREAGRLGGRLRALRRGAIGVRLVPLEQAFGRVGRMVARLARAAGKECDLHTLGGETEIDKAIMDELGGALLHLLRNALDHGLEPPEERERAGKPRRGRLVLSAFQKGGTVVIDVIDDGRGVDREAVRRAAGAAGLRGAGRAIDMEEACALIFAPGLSTAARLSAVSGRGVGLDVVERSLRRLKGGLRARSVEGRGTTFSLTVPITLAMVPALIVRAGVHRFAIPLSAVSGSLRLEAARLRRDGGAAIYDRPEGALPLVRLAALVEGGAAAPGEAERYALVAGPPGGRFGLLVDGFVGQQEVVIKPVGRALRDMPGIAGATDLGDATAVLVLDPEGLVRGGDDVRARA